MFAAIGVADKVDGKPQLLALVHEMPVAGIALCCLTLVGVIGANLQINRLISAWEEAQPAHGVPPPFGDRAARRLGAFPSWSIPVVLAALWLKVALS